ncbi:MAG: cbb3-type cytochrome c oxidase N-terminal domain-containing protein [Chitinophagales bacterium]
MKNKTLFTCLLIFSALNQAFAQADSPIPFSEKYEEQIILGAILLALLIVFFTVIVMFSQLMGEISDMREKILKERGLWKEDEVPVVDKFWQNVEEKLTDIVPVEQEHEIEMDHDYDGIRELDNNLPPWWKWLFYVSIIWSGVYLFHYHVSGSGDLMLDEYEKEIAQAEVARDEYLKKAAQGVDETNVTVLNSTADLGKGKQVYMINCAACHGAEGEGGIGPNLTDDYWLNGGGVKNVFEVIKYGRPQNGMISWQAQLKPLEMQQVASYILSMDPADPSIAKEPEGELWEEEEAEVPEEQEADAAEGEIAEPEVEKNKIENENEI